ncbi:MAG: ABC transporter permease, partial [Candidatus Hermodarchaeota archaeon]|nr:ABC transporter permease [Candidatus Hermodarchaeota archaeon]
ILFLLLILSLTFSLTIFTLVEAQTYQNNVNRQIEYYMGSDLRVFTTPSPITAVDELHAISGVNKATSIIEVAAKIGSIEIHLFGIDPITYLSIGKWQSTSTIGADSHTIFSALASNPDAVVLPHHLANQFNMHSGSHLNITVYDQHDLFLEEKTFEVVGEFLSAPGFGYANPSDPLASTSPISGFGFQVNHVYAFCHIDYFLVEIPSWKSNPYVNLTQLIFANLTPATNHTDIVNAVQELNFVRVVWTPQTFNLKEIDFEAALFLQGVISLLSVSFYAALVISSIALTVFVSAVVRERQIEYAIMRALGGTRRQVTLIIVGEFAGMVLGAFLLGIILGFVFSWLSMFALLKWFPIPFILPFILEYSNPMLFTVLGLVVTCMLAGIYLPARRSGALQIRTILRTL